MKRIEQLTFTRFIIIILVLFAHDTTGPYLQPLLFFPLGALIRSGSTGVSYLFILSGFVMTMVYYKSDQKFDIWTFWRTRFIRLYPLYIFAFGLTCIYYIDSLFQIKPQKILANIFILHSWVPKYALSFNYVAWSMTVEIFFYIFFPFFLMWAYRQPTRTLIRYSLLIWAISAAVFQVLWVGYLDVWKDFIFYFPVLYSSSFVMGVVGGIWYLREGRQENLSTGKRLAVLIASFLVIAIYTVLSLEYWTFLPHLIRPITGFLAPFLTLFIVALALDDSFISKFLVHPALVNAGELAFGIYILHIPVKWLYEKILETNQVANVQEILDWTFLPIILIIAYLVHFYLDTPFRKWMKATLKNQSLRVILLDFLLVVLVGYVLFPLRFGLGREYRSYQDMERLVLWLAFFSRPLLAMLAGSYRYDTIMNPGYRWIKSVLISSTLGSFLIIGGVYTGYAAGWFENFPRSLFLLDWALIVTGSLLIRWVFRVLKIYKAEAYPSRN